MKKVNVTFSVPQETHNDALAREKEDLKLAYIEAKDDPDRKATIADWKNLDTEDWD
jgi:hypothetical protein